MDYLHEEKKLLKFLVASLASREEGRLALAVLPVEPGKGKKLTPIRRILCVVNKLVRVETILLDSKFEEVHSLTFLGGGKRTYAVRMGRIRRVKERLDRICHMEEVTQILKGIHRFLDRLQTPKNQRKLQKSLELPSQSPILLEFSYCLGVLWEN